MPPKVKKYEIYIGKIVIFCFQTILTLMSFGIDFCANLVPFWLDFCVLGVSWGALGPSWGRLGDVRGRLAASTRGSNFLNDFGIDF